MFFVSAVTAQVTDSYRPGGFDYNGASIKTFSVSDNEAVQFSRGNLQYNAALDKWRFALRQYSTACGDNSNIAEGYDGWIDLFGWGTSGWNSGATAYQPWSTSTTSLDYQPGGSYENSLTGAYSNADWGIYNKIENGGKFAGMWRTLTKDEWEYLVGSNTKRNGKNGLATIGGIHKGLLLLPDEWTLPSGCSFTAGFANGYATNQYTYAQWEKMQSAGAVFMQAAGYRFDTEVYEVGGYGGYWSSTCGSESDAWEAYFGEGDLGVTNNSRYDGRSVRLVRRVQKPLVKHGWVDMGLPSGTLWYSCNLGATRPEGRGKYIAWGETRPNENFDWGSYTYGSSEYDITKYCTSADYGRDGYTDNITTLEPSDDAARTFLSDNARTPTNSEWLELKNNCFGEWTTLNGEKGWMFTSKVNGNRLFFPCAGRRYDGSLWNAGSNGYYWTSSLHPDASYNAYYAYINTDGVNIDNGSFRYRGFSVRAVKSAEPAFDANGASKNTFSVSSNSTVHFSKGNLQYNAAQNTWRFAENQYDFIGEDNGNASSSYNGWVDLFGWGTSGWNSGANEYQPWATSETDGDYYVGGSGTNSLTGDYSHADWGVHNRISNGGNQTGIWRTLTESEWEYLLETRTASTACGYDNVRYVKATVNNVAGLIIFPDVYTHPGGVATLNNVNTGDAPFSGYVVTLSEWQRMERAGAIFIPASGLRSGTDMSGMGAYGYYWSSTYRTNSSAWYLYICDDGFGVLSNYRNKGQSVRLVRD